MFRGSEVHFEGLDARLENFVDQTSELSFPRTT